MTSAELDYSVGPGNTAASRERRDLILTILFGMFCGFLYRQEQLLDCRSL
jgi:hypothetical protein